MRKLILIKFGEALANEKMSNYFFFFFSQYTYSIILNLVKNFFSQKVFRSHIFHKKSQLLQHNLECPVGIFHLRLVVPQAYGQAYFSGLMAGNSSEIAFFFFSQPRVQNHLPFRIISHKVPLEILMNNVQGRKARILHGAYIKALSILIKS